MDGWMDAYALRLNLVFALILCQNQIKFTPENKDEMKTYQSYQGGHSVSLSVNKTYLPHWF